MRTIDLFAGCGGFRTGMESAGFSTVFANDIDKRSQRTYEVNTPNIKFECKSLTDIDPNELPEFDCLTGGFPCQPFSVSGKGLGFEDTRGTLFFNIAEILSVRRPKMFLLENVKQLYHHDSGRTFKTILRVLQEELGYNVHYKILNTLDYGLPQNRQRVFIVGFDQETDFSFPEPIHYRMSVRELLEETVPEKYYYREDHKHYKPISDSVTDPDKVYQWRWSYVRENKKGVCPTLLASYMQPTLVYTDRGIRGITPREGLRLQGFPESFEFPEEFQDRDKFHQIGNSVSVPVIESIGKQMLQAYGRNK
jgi:DNA (cytosine-5)-methyltransferase 1